MLKQIITYLNQRIASTAIVTKQYDLCELVTISGVTFPAEFNPDTNEYVNVSDDIDEQSCTSYWRMVGEVSIRRADSETSIYSDSTAIYPLALFVYMKRNELEVINNDQYSADRIAWAITKSWANYDSAARRELEVKKVVFTPGSVLNSNAEITAVEFAGSASPVYPSDQYILVRIDLNVELTLRNGCINDFCSDVAAPTLLTATASGSDIDLSWADNSADEDGFRIYRSSSYNGPYAVIGTNAADDTTFTDVAPDANIVWFYRVRAYMGSVSSAYSNVAACMLSGAAASINIDINGDSFLTGVSGDVDIPVVNTAGTPRGSKVGSDWLLADVTVTIKDQNGNTQGSSTEDAAVDIAPVVNIYNTASQYKSGQTTSYRTGDDGDLEIGRGVGFATLSFNNPFGNTNRFTDTLGGQSYANDIIIDWLHWSQSDRTVMAWYRVFVINKTWNQAVDECLAFSSGGFTTGWRLPNTVSMFSLYNFESATPLNNSPFNWSAIGSGSNALWTSTTDPGTTTNAMIANNSVSALISGRSKTLTSRYVPVRTFTLTELGL